MSHYKITSSLTASDTSYNEIEFKGCDAEVTGETSTCYFVKFYSGLPFMIGKDKFRASSTPQPKPKEDKNMEVADITLLKDGAKIKTYRGVLSPDDPEYLSVKKNVLTWFKLTHGQHYDRITHESVNQISNNSNKTTMAKKATTTETTENTGVVLFEDQAKKVNLPAIPKVMTIGGVEFSEAAIKKEVDAVKKIKLEIILPTDTVEVAEAKRKVYEELDEKRKKFVKTRTQPEAFRKEASKPVTDWVKSLKSQTDAYGNLAKEGELHCAEQIEIWDNYEAEQARIEAERVQKIVDARTVDLQSVAGILNRDSLHWTFEHMPSKLVENTFLEEADDSEWNGLMAELEASVKAKKEKEAAERAEFEAAKGAVFNARIQMLQLVGGYENPQQGVYTKNGHTLTDDQIRSTSDADWMPLVLSHNTPKEVTNPFAASAQTQQEAPAQAVSTNPFEQFVQAIEEDPGTVYVENKAVKIGETIPVRQESFLPHTIWDVPYVEKALAKTTLRIFPIEHQAEGAKNIGDIAYDGKWDNGLMFIIYKNAQQ